MTPRSLTAAAAMNETGERPDSERAMVTDSDMAELIRNTLGDRIAARAKAVEDALVAVDSPEVEAEPEEEQAQQPKTGVETLSGSAASTLPGNQLPRGPRKTLWAGIASVAVAASLAIAFAGNRVAQQPAVPNTTASATPAAPITAAVPAAKDPETRVEDVTITLRVTPENAVLTLDDGSPLPNPYTVHVAPDKLQHRVRAKLAGYEEQIETITFDQSRNVSLALSKQQATSSRRTASVRVASATGSTTTPQSPPTDAPKHETVLGELPSVVKKPPRQLDNDNPFAKP